MTTAELKVEPPRNLLSQAIVESLRSWPELQRRVFAEIHYRGRSKEAVAQTLSLQPEEVAQILEQCEHKLHSALKVFRNGTAHELSEEFPHPQVFAAACCCH
jgi:DNA-directed RNA polymerase specialized sigma24 family protein